MAVSPSLPGITGFLPFSLEERESLKGNPLPISCGEAGSVGVDSGGVWLCPPPPEAGRPEQTWPAAVRTLCEAFDDHFKCPVGRFLFFSSWGVPG